jgi:CubicO group peptidase (beta-lactamase class C family)
MAVIWAALARLHFDWVPNQESWIQLIVGLILLGSSLWLAGKAAGSLRAAGLFMGSIFVLMVFAAFIWARAFPARAYFLARSIAWGESDVMDYQRFPAREIATSQPNFYFKELATPAPFGIVQYTSNGEPMQAPFEQFLESTNTTSLIVIKDDQILYEGYFNGYQRGSIVTSFSMAKSFTSALVGIAIDEGYIGSVNDPVIKYLPELKARGLDELTIKHLLNMSTGIPYVGDDEVPFVIDFMQFTDDALSYVYPDLRGLVLDLKGGGAPVGAEFNYNNYHPQLLGIILERTTGMPPAAYLQEKIWKPLGMEYPGSWSLDSEQTGFELMTAGINGRAIDFARFGRLFLNRGNWQGTQVIPEEWVIESTAPDPADNRPWQSYREDWKEEGGYYKYFWWGVHRPDGNYDFVARGHNGQRIYVAPQENMVIVRFGYDEGGVDSWEYFFMDLIDQANDPAPQALRTSTPEEMTAVSGKPAAEIQEGNVK